MATLNLASCLTPYVMAGKKTVDKYGKSVAVPCGKCPPCLKRRTSNWSFRLMYHHRNCHNAHFITLTYDTLYVPLSKKKRKTLVKSDIQKWIKRVRKAHHAGFAKFPYKPFTKFDGRRDRLYWPKPIKYFAVGEYGSRHSRPHYHVLIYNVSAKLAASRWTFGYVDIGQLTEASVGYTLKYMQKNGKIPQYKGDDRLPEFQLMSKGLGLEYVNPRTIQWHKADLERRFYLNVEGGKKVCMPRYYKDRLYTVEERSLISGLYKGQLEQDHNEYEHTATSEMRRCKAASDANQFRKMFQAADKGRII